MITDSCNSFESASHNCKGPSRLSHLSWYCDRHKNRRRCQSEGFYQESDPLKELNWCCDRGCVIHYCSSKCSQNKKTNLEMNGKKIKYAGETEMVGDECQHCLNQRFHTKSSMDKFHNELCNHFNNYNHIGSDHGIDKNIKTSKFLEASSDKYKTHKEYYENSKTYQMGDYHHSSGRSLGCPKHKSSAEIRERYIAEMEILRSKLNLLKDDIVTDGKRLRQRSESEPGTGELSGGVPKRARDVSPKMKLGCQKLPLHSGVNQSHQKPSVKQTIPFQRESKSLPPVSLKYSDKGGMAKGSFSKAYNKTKRDLKKFNINESDEDRGDSTCDEDLTSREDMDEDISDDDGSIRSTLTSGSSDSNTPSKVGETLGSITLNEEPKSDTSYKRENSLSVPTIKLTSDYHVHVGSENVFRSSLFPNVPPYVKFFMHDIKGPSLPVDIVKHLKWKLSSITPIVIRRTLVNSGFKLVRRSYEQYYKLIYIAPHRKDGAESLTGINKKPPKESNDWTGQWGKHMKSFVFKTLKDFQKLNHFPGTFQIGRKDRLWKNLYRLINKFGKKEFGFIPKTYILPHDRKILRTAWEKSSGPGKGQWIVKPPAAARGTGIKVVHKWGQIPKKRSLIVQKYISQPYLINGSKFDLRLYVLMTSIHPLRIYLYDDGLVRFASVKYSDDVECLSNRFMHLTNYSINKLSTQYQVNADATSCNGHKWSLKSLWTYLTKEGVNVKSLKKNLTDLVIKTIISGESNINILSKNNLPSRYCSYELFGIDVLLDHALKPWLLEVNISPSLHSASPLDLAVKGPLVKELLNIAGFQIPAKLSKEQEDEFLECYGIQGRTHTLCYDKRIYWTALSKEEKAKQESFQNVPRNEYLSTILDNLTPDDVRHLIQFEDELTQINRFEKIFPTTQTFAYHQFFESPRYYNMMLDAWETKYQKNRTEGIQLLASLCEEKLHLSIPLPGGKTKSSLNLSELNCPEAEPETDSEPEKEEEAEENNLIVSKNLSTPTSRSSPKPKTPVKPAVVSKPIVLANHTISRRLKSSNPTPKSSSSMDSQTLEDPLRENCAKVLADIRQNGMKVPAESKSEKVKRFSSCKLENSMDENLSNGKTTLSPSKHIHNACIKMSSSS